MKYAIAFVSALLGAFMLSATPLHAQEYNKAKVIESFDEAIHYFTRTGDPWEINMARFHRGCCHFRLGNLAQAVSDASDVGSTPGRSSG